MSCAGLGSALEDSWSGEWGGESRPTTGHHIRQFPAGWRPAAEWPDRTPRERRQNALPRQEEAHSRYRATAQSGDLGSELGQLQGTRMSSQ